MAFSHVPVALNVTWCVMGTVPVTRLIDIAEWLDW